MNKPTVKKETPQQKFRRKNRERLLKETVVHTRNRRRKLREIAINHYGGSPPKCACCGEKEIRFLTLDHINGGGRKDRLSKNNLSGGLSGWIVKNNFPGGFQVLCMNCNWGKYINGGVCPHKN